MKINRDLLPIKAHFFFFMCAMGPILPQLTVYGKEMGISSVVMGTVTGIVPIIFLLAKPFFGMLVDVYRDYRKCIFMFLIIIMTTSFGLMYFIPATGTVLKFNRNNVNLTNFGQCNETDFNNEKQCSNSTVRFLCSSNCFISPQTVFQTKSSNLTKDYNQEFCIVNNKTTVLTFNKNNNNKSVWKLENCSLNCEQDIENAGNHHCLYRSLTFWCFIIAISVGMIGFNVANSISDAICCDVVGDKYDYGHQRVWGTIGFGLTALLGGFMVDWFSGTTITYTPALIIMLICSVFDLLICLKLELPVQESPKNIIKEIWKLFNNSHVIIFAIFAILAGIFDSFIIYFLFWYVEDLAQLTNTANTKLIEGLIVAAETLGAEILFFYVSGKILERVGHVHCFSMCFVNYAIRLGLISIASNPWWIVPIELVMQGPTYALTYSTIVAYANELAPPGTSATMQGIAAGLDDGVGFAIGSVLSGFLIKYVGGKHALQILSAAATFCSVAHLILHKAFLKNRPQPNHDQHQIEYKSPENAFKATYESVK